MELDPRVRFVDQLKQLRTLAGEPTLTALQVENSTWLVQQTVSKLLAGTFSRVPPWDRIAAFVTACVQIGQSKNLTMPSEKELLEQWRHQHAALAVALDQNQPRDPHPAVSGHTTTPVLEQRRRFGSVPPRAGAFQHRAVAETLTRAVQSGGTAVLTGAGTTTPASVLTGLGGVGKTQLAADHAHALWDDRQVDLLVWISARTRDAITTSYTDIAGELLGQDPAAPERAWRRLLEWLAETPTEWLVVLDDVQDPADLTGLWPPHSSNGQVVVTTRCRDAALHGDRRHVVDVDLFTPAEALTYLAEKLPSRARIDAAIAELAGLAEDLGFLPLALAQAAAYLTNKPLLTTADYRSRLADRRSMLRDVLPKEQDLPDEHQQTVAATWSLSIEAADQLDPAGFARPVLELASLLDPAGTPASVFTVDTVVHYLIARLEREITAEDVLGGLECLRRFSLLTLDPDQVHRAVRVHALVQRAVRDAVPADILGDLARADADALLHVWEGVKADRQGLVQSLRSNTSTLQDNAEEHLWQRGGHPVLFYLAKDFGEAGQLGPAVTVMRRLHHQASIRLGPDHLTTLAARGNVAFWRGQAGDPAGAVIAFEQLLADELRVLGPDHLTTLATRENIAFWRGEAGDPAGAVTAFEQLLTDQLRVLGPDHPNTLATRNNIVFWRGRAGAPAGAAFDKLLTDLLRVLGPDHPNTLATRSNLAALAGRVRDAADAVIAFEQLLADELRVLGPDHPHTLITRNNLATWRGRAGDPAGAVTALEKLLNDQLRVFGPDHPHTLGTRDNLAVWRGAAG